MATNTFLKTDNQEATFGENSPGTLALQQRLNKDFGAGLTEDSRFGAKTQSAFDQFLGGPKISRNSKTII